MHNDLKNYTGAHPTIVSYNASVVKIYNATNSIEFFYNKKDFFPFVKSL
jgi:hypothetical protein